MIDNFAVLMDIFGFRKIFYAWQFQIYAVTVSTLTRIYPLLTANLNLF